MIVKARDVVTKSWVVYHPEILAAPETGYVLLDLPNTPASSSTIWNDTSPTDTQFTVGTSNAMNNSSGNYVAYLFAGIAGFSKFGSYDGNGSTDGPFINCGFTPALVISKRISLTGTWNMWDSARSPINPSNERLFADQTAAEVISGGEVDLVANGFKIRNTGAAISASSETYL